MHQSTQYERKSLNGWSCQDVDVLYEKISKVGSGTYGEVNKARDRANPSKFVALKKIKDQSETQGFPITAMREISLLQQCNHQNIIQLLNVATSNIPDPDSKRKKKRGSTFLVFEYMEHELLGLVQTYQFTSPQVKCIMKQILEGLEYIHSRDIIHRDIKSANILMNNKGEVKIADFGLARKVNPNFSGKLTQRVVTRWYRAPELLLGCKKYSTQIDIWALGCVFAELLMGKSHALFPAQKTPDQMTLICEKCGTPNESTWPGIKDLPFYNNMVPKKMYPKLLLQYMCKQNKNLSMDPTALDLLDRMLTFNPEARITTKQALDHPYFKTGPLPCAVHEMPKFEKDCHAYVLNLKRKARVNIKNPVEEINDTSLTKITLLNPNIVQPNPTYYEPQALPEYNKAKSMYNQQNPILVTSRDNSQVYSDPIITNTNNNYGQNIISQNQNSNGNINAFNNIINLTQISNAGQNNEFSLSNINSYNGMNNMNSTNNINALGKLATLNSMNTHNSTSNLDTTITNMTNLSYFNDFNNVNLSNASTMSNISNMSNSQNVSNPINNQPNPSNNSFAKQQPNNSFTGGYNNYNNNNSMLYLNYYLSMMNYPLQYNNKFDQDLTANASFAPYLNNTRPIDLSHQELMLPKEDPNNKVKEIKQNKGKGQGKRAKPLAIPNGPALMLDILEDKKVMDTINELNFDILELYNPSDDLIGFKRKGIPNIQDFDSLLKKRQLDNHFGIN